MRIPVAMMMTLASSGVVGGCRCDGEPGAQATPGVSASSVEPTPQGLAGLPAARPVDFEGSCVEGRPMGALSSYTHVIVGSTKGQRIRVRATPAWSGTDHRNVLGSFVADQPMPAYGPLKGRPSAGIGFSIPLRDPSGRTCRGYVSLTVVRAVACHHYDGEPGSFPQPLDVTPGPCVVAP